MNEENEKSDNVPSKGDQKLQAVLDLKEVTNIMDNVT
jgi:hypothetical protein